MADTNTRDDLKPTKKIIEDSLKWLVSECKDGDSLVFYFSGHGLQQVDNNNDELDGYDETICPIDFLREGMIVDDDINATIVQPLVKGVTLHAIVDACHSGTILDLAYVYDQKNNKWIDNSPPSDARRDTKGGLAICLSACEDDKKAADSTAFDGKAMHGVMTYLLVDLVKKYSGLTYGDLLDMIQERIEDYNQGDKCLQAKTIAKMFGHKRLSQKIQLSSSEKFDVYRKHFRL